MGIIRTEIGSVRLVILMINYASAERLGWRWRRSWICDMEHNKSEEDGEVGKILKPPGEAGHPQSGGYTVVEKQNHQIGILGTRIFWTKLRMDSNLDRQIEPKNSLFIKFPRHFWCAKFFG